MSQQFLEGEDWILHKFMKDSSKAGGPRTDYHVTLEMGKELAMLEDNDKGRQVRRYFIECERRWREEKKTGINRSYVEGTSFRVKLINRIVEEPNQALQANFYRQLVHLDGQLGLETLPFSALIPPEPLTPPLVTRFWEVYRLLEANPETRVNHARSPNTIAVNLNQFLRLAARSGLPIQADRMTLARTLAGSRNPKFIRVTPVNSRFIGRTIRCHVFMDIPSTTLPVVAYRTH